MDLGAQTNENTVMITVSRRMPHVLETLVLPMIYW